MRTLLIFVGLMMAFAVMSQSEASTYDPKIRGLYSEELITAIIKDQKEKHIDLTIREKDYIYSDDDAVLSRAGYINIPKKPEGKEIYVGR